MATRPDRLAGQDGLRSLSSRCGAPHYGQPTHSAVAQSGRQAAEAGAPFTLQLPVRHAHDFATGGGNLDKPQVARHTAQRVCMLAEILPGLALAAALQLAHARVDVRQALVDELAFEAIAHAQRRQLVQHCGIEHAIADRQCRHRLDAGLGAGVGGDRPALPAGGGHHGLGKEGAGAGLLTTQDGLGVTSALSTMTGT